MVPPGQRGFLHWSELGTRFFKLLLRRTKGFHDTLLEAKSDYFGTPLYKAAAAGLHEIIELLLNAGARIDADGGVHGTAIMCACECGRLDVVRILINRGARTWDDMDGQRTSCYNLAKNYPKLQRWLLVGRFMELPWALMPTPNTEASDKKLQP